MQIEVSSETWQVVDQWLEERLQRATLVLRTHGKDVADTEYARGQVDVILSLRALPTAAPDAVVRSAMYDPGDED